MQFVFRVGIYLYKTYFNKSQVKNGMNKIIEYVYEKPVTALGLHSPDIKIKNPGIFLNPGESIHPKEPARS